MCYQFIYKLYNIDGDSYLEIYSTTLIFRYYYQWFYLFNIKYTFLSRLMPIL